MEALAGLVMFVLCVALGIAVAKAALGTLLFAVMRATSRAAQLAPPQGQ
jgi:hypothetical protein